MSVTIKRRPRYLWIDHYKNCGCGEEALRESELTGYCKYHGHSVQERIKLPLALMPPGIADQNIEALQDGSVHSRDDVDH